VGRTPVPDAVSAGRLIVFEGAEGVGKTTQIRRLAARLEACALPVRVVHEPGATPVGLEIRRLLLESTLDIVPRAEALLFIASRAQLVEHDVRPALAAGEVVLADRFFLSTYAYQGAGRGIPVEELREANRFATAGLVPDLTLLLELPASEGLARADSRGARDRIERAADDFHARVVEAFARFADPLWQAAHPECGPVVRIDARGSEDNVSARVDSALAERWPETFAALRGSYR
jgi:dTMP kinase